MWPLEIEVHFKELWELSEQLNELAAVLQEAAGQGREMAASIEQVWVSENADLWKKAGIQSFTALFEAAGQLKNSAEDMRKMAAQIYEAECRNSSIAQIRSY